MDSSNKTLWVALIAVAIIAIGGYFYPAALSSFGAAIDSSTNFGKLGTAQLKVGTNCDNGNKYSSCTATAINGLNWGTCSLIGDVYSVNASTTKAFDCAVTGAVSTDVVLAGFATSTAAGQGWRVTGASASTTAGFDTFTIANESGVTAVIPASLASTTKYINLR